MGPQKFSKKPTSPHAVRSLQSDDVEHISAWNPPEPIRYLPLSLLADARKHLALGDRRAASIEAVTAIESVLEPFIKDRCRAKGVSNNTLNNYDKSHFIGDYLKLLLPLILDGDELQKFLDDHIQSLIGVNATVSQDDVLALGD